MKNNRVTLGIVGLGMWGEKLVRIADALSVPICGFDPRKARAQGVQITYPSLTVFNSLDRMLADPSVTAVIVATPPDSHFDVAYRALSMGKHVLIEKPMTQQTHQARRLIDEAQKRHRTIMVDHTYLFSEALATAKRVITSGALGGLARIESTRVGSRAVTDSTVLWDLAAHDAALALDIIGSMPERVRTIAPKISGTQILENAYIELQYRGSLRYTAHVSWNHPLRIRRLIIIGSNASLVLEWHGAKESLAMVKNDITKSLTLKKREPLKEMLRHFIRTVQSSNQPLSNGHTGADVVRIIEKLHTSWNKNGLPITV